jgi:dimethylhistidine N-methyltransferase
VRTESAQEIMMNVHASALAKGQRLDPKTSAFATDILEGLAKQPKQLPPKYFYDVTGSELFEQITVLPEYYPTRTELGILRDKGAEIAAILPKHAALIEFGAGATTKVRLLLEQAAFDAYVPVDISGEFLNAQASALRQDFSDLQVYPVTADFSAPFELPETVKAMPKVGFFPGSTIGNFEPHEACGFLRSARQILGPGALMLVGADLEKDERALYAAYNDTSGVTARFNLNLLVRINRELGGNFDLSAFTHRAIYNRERHRIEMHLVSRKSQTVRILGRSFAFRTGETIHTENSYKYSIERFTALAKGSGWKPRASWTDADGLFSVHALVASE